MLRFPLTLMLFLCFNLVYGQESKEGDMLIKSIYFGGGSYYVDPDQADGLEEFILEIENLEYYQIIIFSHTDNIGGKEYNEWLSKKRSAAVFDILLEIPIDEDLIKIRDFGMENPLYTNKHHLGRRANRRVDVILMPIVF